jgi:hypothetical protein
MLSFQLRLFYSAKIIVIIVPKARELKYTLSSLSEVTLSGIGSGVGVDTDYV